MRDIGENAVLHLLFLWRYNRNYSKTKHIGDRFNCARTLLQCQKSFLPFVCCGFFSHTCFVVSSRQMIMSGCAAFTQVVESTRIEAELLPQWWEQVRLIYQSVDVVFCAVAFILFGIITWFVYYKAAITLKPRIAFITLLLRQFIVNWGKWLWNPAKFFVVAFCSLFGGLTVHKTWQNTIVGYVCSCN